MRTASIALAVVALLAGQATAQNVIQAKKVDGTLELQQVTVDGVKVASTPASTQKAAVTTIYNNTAGNGWYSTSGSPLDIWYDWGLVTAADNPLSATHNCVVQLNLGYVSSLNTGATTSIIFYSFNGGTGFCSGLGTQTFGILVYGLPGTIPTWGATGWTFGMPLDEIFGPGSSLCFVQAEGPIGYGYDYTDNANTGPLLVGPPVPSGDADAFDFYNSTGQTCYGSYWFGGYGATNPYASFYLAMTGHESWTNTVQGSGAGPCVTSCGGLLLTTGTGCTCGGDAVTIAVNITVPYGNPAQHQLAMIVGGGIGSVWVFPSGCSFDVMGPYFYIMPLGPANPLGLPGAIPAGLSPPLGAYIQFLVKDTVDAVCGVPPARVITSDILGIWVY